MRHGEFAGKFLRRFFQKATADPTRGALVALASAKFLFRRVLFCQAQGGACAPGLSGAKQFSFAPLASKKKAGKQFGIACVERGTPTCVFPSAKPLAWHSPRVALGKDKVISPSAEGDRRSRRLRRAFEKARAKLPNRQRSTPRQIKI